MKDVVLCWLVLLLPCLQLSAQENPESCDCDSIPLDDIVERTHLLQHPVLDYPDVQERDILWERRVWREIDTRQKMNLPFRYPEEPFFSVLLEEIEKGNLTAYRPADDEFTTPMTPDEVHQTLSQTDTIRVFDPETYEETIQVVSNDVDPASIVKYRLKEVWWVDTRYSQLKFRILGIAPVQAVNDESGNFLYEKPIFWIYYPKARYTLARHKVFNPYADASPLSWEDWIEMRFFDSYVTKVSNVHDRRLKDYLEGVDRLHEADRLEQEIFNYEMDLWSY